jgi:hypothetical protein
MNSPGTWGSHFVLINNLDLTGVALTPVGADTTPADANFDGVKFTGAFDGGGFVISGAALNQPAGCYAGLFGCLGAGARIRNLNLEDVTVSGSQYIGGLVGKSGDSPAADIMIEACLVSGSVVGEVYVGGLVGINSGSIKDCGLMCDVAGSDNVGGLAGGNSGGAINTSFASGSVSGNLAVGGFAGKNENSGTITDCYA